MLARKTAILFSSRGQTYSQKILSVGQPIFWFDAAEGVYQTVGGSVAGNGDPVGSWLDKSTNHRDVSNTLTARPTLRTNQINGLPAVQFDGSNDNLAFGSLISNTIVTLFAVINKTAPGTSLEIMLETSKMVFSARGVTTNALGFFVGAAEGQSSLTLTTSFSVVTYVVNNYNDVDIRLNGTEQTVTTGSVFGTSSNSFIGGSAALYFAPIKIATLILYNGVLSPPQIAIVEQALAERYGLAGSF